MSDKRKLEIALPFPPSVNHYWRHTRAGKHYISDEGKRFQSQVFMRCMAELPFTQAVGISVDVTMPDNRARDLDNLWKVLLDSLSKAKIIEDDCWQKVPSIAMKAVGVSKENAGVVVTIEEV